MSRLTKTLLWTVLTSLFTLATAHAGPYPGGTSPHSHQGASSGGILADPGVTYLEVTTTVTAPTGIFGNLTASGTITQTGPLSVSSYTNIPPNFNLVRNGNFLQWSSTTTQFSAQADGTALILPPWSYRNTGTIADVTWGASTSTLDGESGRYVANFSLANTWVQNEQVGLEQTLPNFQQYKGKKLSIRARISAASGYGTDIRCRIGDGVQSTAEGTITAAGLTSYQTCEASLIISTNATTIEVGVSYIESAVGPVGAAGQFNIASIMVTEGNPTAIVADPNEYHNNGTLFNAGMSFGQSTIYSGGFSLNASTIVSVITLPGTPVAYNGVRISTSGTRIQGTITNDNAHAGDYGEYISSAALNLTNAVTTNQYGDLVSITLTAGDWDISYSARWNINGATWSDGFFGVSSTSGNNGTGLTAANSQDGNWASSSTTPLTFNSSISGIRVTLSSSTTYYLKYFSLYTVGTPAARGEIRARRIR